MNERDLRILNRSIEYIDKMARGIDPLTDEPVPETDLINQIRISRCLYYVRDTLQEYKRSLKNKIKLPFQITPEQMAAFPYKEEGMPVSVLAKTISDLTKDPDMQRLKANDVNNWLTDGGYLEMLEYNGRYYRRPTLKGRQAGIYTEERMNAVRMIYTAVLFNQEAQKLIVENAQRIAEYSTRAQTDRAYIKE